MWAGSSKRLQKFFVLVIKCQLQIIQAYPSLMQDLVMLIHVFLKTVDFFRFEAKLPIYIIPTTRVNQDHSHSVIKLI